MKGRDNLKKLNIDFMAKVAILSAISVIVMLFEIPLWFAPPFYKIDLSEVVVMIGGFALGPFAALLIEFIKILLNLLINGTITAGVGELANFLMGVAFVVPAAWWYNRKKVLNHAVVGMAVGTLCLTLVGAALNLYLLLPAYSMAYGIPIQALVDMGNKVNGSITSIETLVLFATTPFNLLKGVASSVITILLYKRLSPILHKSIGKNK